MNNKKKCAAKVGYSHFKKTLSDKINDQELRTAMNQDLNEKLQEYKALVQKRKIREAQIPMEPEIYHLFMK